MGSRLTFKLASSQNSQVSTALNRVSPQPVTSSMAARSVVGGPHSVLAPFRTRFGKRSVEMLVNR